LLKAKRDGVVDENGRTPRRKGARASGKEESVRHAVEGGGEELVFVGVRIAAMRSPCSVPAVVCSVDYRCGWFAGFPNYCYEFKGVVAALCVSGSLEFWNRLLG